MVYATTNGTTEMTGGMTGPAGGRPAIAPLLRAIFALLRCDRAAIGPLTALMLIPICGAIAYSVELGSWQYMQRSMQNAADSAAIAAATVNNAGTTGTTSLLEAKAAAAKYGFIDGGDNGYTAVSANQVTCPTGAGVCYQATISTVFPLLFSKVLGFNGDAAYGSGRGQTILASAIATTAGGGGSANDVCVWTFTSLQTNGTPDANLAGCAVVSNGTMTCTGGGLHADYGYAGDTVSGRCAEEAANNLSNQTTFPTDKYAPLATSSNIPPNICGGNTPSQLVKNKGKWGVPAANKSTNEIAAGTPSWTGGQKTFCGDVQLTGNVTLTGTSTLIIENGRLDLNGYTISTQTGAAATIVFSGDPTSTAYSHYPSSLNGGGMIDIAAPDKNSSSPWKNVAIYQDPRMTTSTVDFTYAGNDPAWKISGVVYLPNATTTFSGVVNKASNGEACIILIVDQTTINGTGKIIGDVSNCSNYDPPAVDVGTGTKVKLVQ